VQKGTSDTRFLYDGDALVAEYDASGALAKRYVHGSNAAADDPLVDYVGATLANRRFLETDHQGSVILIADNAGATIATNRYDEYGVPQGTNQGRFQYTGQIWLSELNLYHYKARLYSPYLGRFLQVDPIGYKDQMNLYAYVGDDPVSATDETGERITPVGSSREQEELKRLILKVARSAPALRVRYEILARSSIQHVVRSADVGERSGSATSIPWNASHGQGSSTTNRINLKGEVLFWDKPGWASPEDIVAHELFGHAYDADRGRLDKTLNPNTQVRYSEESAVAVENEYRASAGEPLRNTYGGRRVGPYPYRQQQKQDPCPRATGASSTCGSGIDGVWQ
jgi:RHS repeat-associated protein